MTLVSDIISNMKILYILVLITSFACSTGKEPFGHPSGLVIDEISSSKWTYLVRQNLLQLSQVYDLTPFLFTKKIQIESKVIPHSHPVLTLNTRFAERPSQLLALFLNQQFHWWLKLHPEQTSAAILELKKSLPNAPETLSLGKDSTFLKILAGQLEAMALEYYLGHQETQKILTDKIMQEKQDPWIYKVILARGDELKTLLRGHRLLPTPLH